MHASPLRRPEARIRTKPIRESPANSIRQENALDALKIRSRSAKPIAQPCRAACAPELPPPWPRPSLHPRRALPRARRIDMKAPQIGVEGAHPRPHPAVTGLIDEGVRDRTRSHRLHPMRRVLGLMQARPGLQPKHMFGARVPTRQIDLPDISRRATYRGSTSSSASTLGSYR